MSKRYYYITPDDYEIAKKNGIGSDVVYQRVHVLGWDIDRAIREPVRKKTRRKLSKLAEENGISSSAFYYRLQKGWDENEAATTPPLDNKKRVKMSLAERRVFPVEVVEEAKRNGIRYRTLWSRVRRQGWSVERAMTQPVMTKKQVAENLKKYDSIFKQENKLHWKKDIS